MYAEDEVVSIEGREEKVSVRNLLPKRNVGG
jgi:hypothetical protein